MALGGGRVIDSAKAIAGADGLRVAAIPTTLSGAEMTPFHRMPAGVDELQARAAVARDRRPGADGVAADARPRRERDERARARDRGALHAAREPGRRDGGAARGHAARARAGRSERRRSRSARCSPATRSGSAGFAVHHAVCQTIVRVAGTPHAQTNAVMLPHFVRMMEARAPGDDRSRQRSAGTPPSDAVAARIRRDRLSTSASSAGARRVARRRSSTRRRQHSRAARRCERGRRALTGHRRPRRSQHPAVRPTRRDPSGRDEMGCWRGASRAAATRAGFGPSHSRLYYDGHCGFCRLDARPGCCGGSGARRLDSWFRSPIPSASERRRSSAGRSLESELEEVPGGRCSQPLTAAPANGCAHRAMQMGRGCRGRSLGDARALSPPSGSARGSRGASSGCSVPAYRWVASTAAAFRGWCRPAARGAPTPLVAGQTNVCDNVRSRWRPRPPKRSQSAPASARCARAWTSRCATWRSAAASRRRCSPRSSAGRPARRLRSRPRSPPASSSRCRSCCASTRATA